MISHLDHLDLSLSDLEAAAAAAAASDLIWHSVSLPWKLCIA